MREYETLVVLHPDLAEAGTKEMVARIRSILEAQKGVVRSVDEWGLRELAYPIRKQKRGFYVVVQHDSPTAAVAELERQLKLADSVLRFMTVRRSRVPAAPRGSGESQEPASEGAEGRT
jgi:small subunit ribosomal protein S6